ncbi:Plug domain-containing protein [Helicobacter sp. 11S02596-1]|uniref:TonB-dependent receptor plug domain-containing protein n=1 Tax=Helicobacter sp. 11S02596-1 TaxID=1476194 RepID=UPI000BA77AFF|nr:Plug domain-containing protein [Helicobacter sp. 11S02596-1]PAF44689.1 hypothetical protein BJI48_01470 [Helicobacter sp. 11S02596-1]
MKWTQILLAPIALGAILQADPQEAMLNKIITTATGFDTPLKDEVRNILLIDKQTIKDKGYQSIEQALRYVPYVTFANHGFLKNDIDLRSQGKYSYYFVKVLINRVPINTINSHGSSPLDAINIEDVESIEIIPGGGGSGLWEWHTWGRGQYYHPIKPQRLRTYHT